MNVLMKLLTLVYSLADIVPKLTFKVKTTFGKYSVFSSTIKSDSDSTPYTNYVEKAVSNQKTFSRFRRSYSYRLILEHVDYCLGKEYLKRLSAESIRKYSDSNHLSALSRIGTPRKFYFKHLGWTSPTVLRYLFVCQNLIELFDTQEIKRVGEIGVGFGGQLAVMQEFLSLEMYAIYDLPQVAMLAKKVLVDSEVNSSIVSVEEIEPPLPASYDLVVSNYAFSELPYEVQLKYLLNIFKSSKRGYLTMNSGRGNISGRTNGKMQLSEIKCHLPFLDVIEEDPLTGPDNYIIIWGQGT